ncbi:dual OB domain-containing protein [Candidatus Spongiihabitans sp.]|uniref:dual OB domain-containing protein n=1 Tax=Candidatus Spongiihabitans sp. TaxID=3101308 RepID=UPI003C7A3FC5
MSYTKTIVCLANSRRTGGYCVAGKEVVSEGCGGWIRPVSERETEEISQQEQTLPDGSLLQLLDVVTIPMQEPKPKHHQQENHLIDGTGSWEKTGTLNQRDLPALLDDVSDTLWINGSSTVAGNNDRVPVADTRNLENSLLLIQPTSLTIIVQYESYKGGGRPDVRAEFIYQGCDYSIRVTDPDAEKKYQDIGYTDHKAGKEMPHRYPVAVDDVYLCVSLADEFEGYCYKLVAGIIGGEA